MELSLAKKDPKEMILLKQNDRKAYVIMEYYGHYEDAYQKVYGVTLDKVKAEILKAESIESHKKKTESELPMTWEKFGELEGIFQEKLEEFNNNEDALFASGWCFDDCTMEEAQAELDRMAKEIPDAPREQSPIGARLRTEGKQPRADLTPDENHIDQMK